ncbi:pyridine nucleotide-disulfide oxidoreductase domain-containing protein [Ditylenchus destructor]|uniref:NADPH:adrenodoxin oxidoreductase, mitochondrial n=1 Tax=Ditylenchus destructor TaxID=166010 RepID=A0AAD4N535_9BILA|nr:pyridine nucleotide-disulfide oxidoreductase domain-containing protein [Ditylenchus destructor]
MNVRTVLKICRHFSTRAAAHLQPKVAIVGSGPAGLYACSRLLQNLPKCSVDVFDRNQVPYGLVYYGVAPDHYDMKKCTNQFERMFTENSDRLSLFCNVIIGQNLRYQELCKLYDAVILAYGANKPRSLNLRDENAINCFSGSDFVSWYNGQPKNSGAPLLDLEHAVVLGNGNVAIDCSRILLSPVDKLAQTDVPEYALRELRQSIIRNVRILGRRGPIEASFTIKELRELLNLEGCSNHCIIPEETISKMKEVSNVADRPKKRILELMMNFTVPKHPGHERQCSIEFFKVIESIQTNSKGRVESIKVRDRQTNELIEVPCDLLIYAIGFENILLEGVPRKDNRLLMDDWCRVHSENDEASVYATGWCAHDARGVIAESQQQAVAVVDELVKDWNKGQIKPRECQGAKELLDKREVPYITWDEWKYVDECERRMGALLGKPREKIADVQSLLRIRNN